MTNEEKILIKTLWNSGNSAVTIARLLPYKREESMAMVNSLLEDGTISKENQMSLTKKILAAYEAYKNPYIIAEKLSMPINTVKTVLGVNKKHWQRQQHYKKRKPPTVDSLCDRTQLIVSDLKAGKKKSDVAKERGVARQYVYMIYDKYVRGVNNE